MPKDLFDAAAPGRLCADAPVGSRCTRLPNAGNGRFAHNSASASAKALSVDMGHASIEITFNRYGKLLPGGESEVGRLLAAYPDDSGTSIRRPCFPCRMIDLSQPATHALTSLCDHPAFNTPDRISNGPSKLQQIDTAEIRQGLRELEAQSLARESFGAWELTEAGSQRCG